MVTAPTKRKSAAPASPQPTARCMPRRRSGHRHHGDERRSFTHGAGHRHLDAVRAGGHQPQLAAVQVGLAAHRAGHVRRRRAVEADIGTQGAHRHPLDRAAAQDAHRSLREAGNDAGRADDDADAVRAGGALEVGVRRADVRGGGHRRGRDQAKGDQMDTHATVGPGPSSCPTRGRRGLTPRRPGRPSRRPPRPAAGPRTRTGRRPGGEL